LEPDIRAVGHHALVSRLSAIHAIFRGARDFRVTAVHGRATELHGCATNFHGATSLRISPRSPVVSSR
jgi:hypothetical protein